MGNSDLILAIDIGTGATKAILFDAQLRPVSIIKKHYPILIPFKGWSEQEPDALFNAVLAAIGESLAAVPEGQRVAAISFSCQLYSILAVGKDDRLLSNSITWSDTRSAQAALTLRQHPSALQIVQRTGCPIDSVYPLAKIKWLRENLYLPPDARFVTIKEYILHRLSGEWASDWGIASATGLFNIRTHEWDAEALNVLGIGGENLSPLVSPRAVLRFREDVRRQAGIPPGMPLVVGGGDGQLASLSIAAESPEALAVNVGTSAAARAVVRQPNVDPAGHLWTYVADEDLWVTGGMVSSGGIVFEWFLNNFVAPEEASSGEAISPDLYTLVDRLAAGTSPGAEDLLFIPYLSGAQAPFWLPQVRGSFTGVDLRHTRGHFARAVLEGIARSIHSIAEAIEACLNRSFDEVYVTGGLSSSEVWLQIAADMFDSVIVVPETTEGSARGAAILAMFALGMKSSLQDFQRVSKPLKKIYPNEEAQKVYQSQKVQFAAALEKMAN